MSFDQALICRGSGGIYAASWLAGTSSSQVLDVERVNVTKTCDALNLSLRAGIEPSKRTLELGNSEDSSSVVVKEKLSFRVCSNIWFGTLKIYQQQVNNLYKLSADLATRSSACDIFREAIKRKSNSPSYTKSLKRRRITTTETITSGKSNPNYSQMLEDFEEWTQQYCHNSEDASLTNLYAKSSSVRPRTQVHIREITIREISATTAYDDISELDDEYGFGEATNEDIATFFTFNGGFEGQNMFVNTTQNKRKIICEGEPPGKQTRYSHDTTINNERSEGTPLASDFLSTPLRPPRTTREISETPTTHENENLYCEDKANDSIPLCTSPALSINKIKDEPLENDQEMPIITPTALEVLKQENYVNDIKVTPKAKTKKNKSKLIIDENIKIEESEILEQLRPPQKAHSISLREILRKSKHKKRKSAKELLKRLNKRTLQFCKFFKQKIFINQKQFQYEYLQLLHDILKLDYRDEWATEIFPEWQSSCKSPKMRMKTRSAGNVLLQQTPVTMGRDSKTPKKFHLIYDNPIIPTNDDENNIVHNASFLLFKKDNDKMDVKSNFVTPDEWSPFGVMKKLLKIWRYWPDCKVDANNFCHSAETRIGQALTFSSLLSLSKSQFIELTKRPTTIEMDKIIMGSTCNNVLKADF